MNGDEAAIFLKMPKSTLLKLCSEGQLPGVKVGRQWRFNRFALETWLQDHSGEATSLPEESVGEPVEVDFPAKLQKAESTVSKHIKPVVEEMVGSVGGDDFDSVGEVTELDEFEGVGEVIEQPEVPEPAKPAAKAARKTVARPTSALELMAEISEKSQGKKASKSVPANKEARTRKSVQPPAATRPTYRDAGTESSSGVEAVEISRPYNKPGAIPPPPARGKDRPNGSFNAFRKLSYWLVILVVLGAAGFGIKQFLAPGKPAPSPLAPSKPQPKVPVLPDFQVVYKHNDTEDIAAGNSQSPVAPTAPTRAPMPAAVTETIATPTPTPTALVEAPTPKPVALTPEVPTRTAPITSATPSQPALDPNLESINRLQQKLIDLPGCIITSNKNEIRIKFEEGIFASGLKIDKNAREQLASVGSVIAKEAPDFWLIIEGQTDGTAMRQQSPFRDNYTLGLRRSVAATEVLREDANFPADRLLVSSTGGMSQPFSSDVPNAAARNRTVVLRLVPKTGPVPPSIQ
ncbi:MAG: helix-turn-helix domain-containing protein [bacterium]